MKHLHAILAALLLAAAPAQAQTVKALSYNTNGQFITGTNTLTFSNAIQFASGDVQITDGGMIRWGGSDRIEVETYTLHGDWNFTEPGSVRENLDFSTNLNSLWTATNASNARSAVGMPLPALTNTSNVTMMRALSGSTNTNHPFSGTVSVVTGTNNTNTLTFSNGILQSVQ